MSRLRNDLYCVQWGVKLYSLTPSERLCVPKIFRHEILDYFHQHLGHLGTQRLFFTLAYRVYWKGLFEDIRLYCRSCDVCLRSKRNYGFQIAPLNPLAVVGSPGVEFSMDHKILSRPTKQGHTAILVIIDFSGGWPIFQAVPDVSAYATAKVFIKDVICTFGICDSIVTDRGVSFCAQF